MKRINEDHDDEGIHFAVKEFLENLGIDGTEENVELFMKYFVQFEFELRVKTFQLN